MFEFFSTYLFHILMVMQIDAQLLCTFSDIQKYKLDMKNIQEYYDVVFDKIFILQDVDNLDSLMLTYNVDKSNITDKFYMDTISVHRKKDSNTLYTINSLNNLIRSLNNNVLDTNFKIDWCDYKNCILLTDVNNLYKIIHTRLYDIIKI